MAQLIVVVDGIFDDEMTMQVSIQKKKVDRLHYDGEKILDNIVQSDVESICIEATEKLFTLERTRNV
jgi:hypothetical protein